jgi:sec-independent protein translocase protein TatA
VIALFSSIGWQEMFLLFFIGLLLFGRNLPDAGRSLGRVVAQLKRSFQDFKDQIDRDGDLRDAGRAFKETAREVKNVAKVPRAMSNPAGALKDLTHEAMSAAVRDEPTDGPTDHDADHDTMDDDPVVEVESGDPDPTGDPDQTGDTDPTGDTDSPASASDSPEPATADNNKEKEAS